MWYHLLPFCESLNEDWPTFLIGNLFFSDKVTVLVHLRNNQFPTIEKPPGNAVLLRSEDCFLIGLFYRKCVPSLYTVLMSILWPEGLCRLTSTMLTLDACGVSAT